MENKKKPFYKKWWFWLLAIIIIGVIAGVGSSSDNSSSSEQNVNTSSENENWYRSGTYKVGAVIKAGEYLVECVAFNCYIQVSKDSSGTLDSIVSNDNLTTRTYITLLDGQYFKVTGGKFIEEQKANKYSTSNEYLSQGMYKVGKDIEPGEYKIIADDSNCYIEISKDSFHILGSIVANDNISLNETTYVTVFDGQYLKVNGGKIYKSN